MPVLAPKEAIDEFLNYLDGLETVRTDEDGKIIHPVHGELVKRYTIPWAGWYADVYVWSDGTESMEYDTMD